MTSLAAIDLGATSGRVVVGGLHSAGSASGGRGGGGPQLHLRQVARFLNTPVRLADGLHWDVLALYSAAMTGLAQASREETRLIGAAVDSWAVDYGLLRSGRLLGNPVHYRDERNHAGVDAVHAVVDAGELYRRNGLQHLPFNTVFQLVSEARDGLLSAADTALLIPDLLGFWATGRRVAERTNASTTGLLPVAGAGWDAELLERLGLPGAVLPELVEPGTDLGAVLPAVAEEFGIADGVRLTTVGSHDTASAVVGAPLESEETAYISCGTWSLVGTELSAPLASEDARRAGFTNEGGVDGTTRFLKNVMGLWLLSESLRTWAKRGQEHDLLTLLAQASAIDPALTAVPTFDAGDPCLLAPGDMPARIGALIERAGAQPPTAAAVLVRSIVQSLAVSYADAVRDLEQLTGRPVRTVHVVGGGAQNELLCQLTADTVGVPVVAGPVEATAMGNLLVQARTHGLLCGGLDALRDVVRRSAPPRRYLPRTKSTRAVQLTS